MNSARRDWRSARPRVLELAAAGTLWAAVLPASGLAQNFLVEIDCVEMRNVVQEAEWDEAREGMWRVLRSKAASATEHSVTTGDASASITAQETVNIPKAGMYYVWARHQAHSHRPRPFCIAVGGNVVSFATIPYDSSHPEFHQVYNDSEPERSEMVWARREVKLEKGDQDLELGIFPREPGVKAFRPVVNRIVITDDEKLKP